MKNIVATVIVGSLLLQALPITASEKQPTAFKSFIQWCQQRNSIPKATKHTVDVILEEYRTKSCKVANRKLKSFSSLGLPNKQITDLRPLANLPELRLLILRNNQITDITPLATLTGLTYINLSNNQIANIKPLANLTKLSGLSLKNNQITDLSPLAKLTDLQGLYLTKNHLSDLKPLANLKILRRLEVSGNQVSEKDCPLEDKEVCNFDPNNEWGR